MDTITLLVAALATARITLLITTDRITRAPREWLLRRMDADSLGAYLIVCNWCVSVWAGAGMAVAGAAYGSWPWIWAVPLALAFSMTAGVLASREGE